MFINNTTIPIKPVTINADHTPCFFTILSKWLGTPFHHGASLRQIGCDCYGLIVGVARELGRNIPAPLPHYSNNINDISSNQRQEVTGHFYTFASVIPREDTKCGDILIFHHSSLPIHFGWLIDGEQFIHAHHDKGVIIERYNNKWKKRHAITGRLNNFFGI